MSFNFLGQNLRNRSFISENMENANFSYEDIRGKNFSQANLKGTKLIGTKAGLQKYWAVVFIIFSCLLSVISALFWAKAVSPLMNIFAPVDLENIQEHITGVFSLIIFITFMIIHIYKDLFARLVIVLMIWFFFQITSQILDILPPIIGYITRSCADVCINIFAGTIVGVLYGGIIGIIVRNISMAFAIAGFLALVVVRIYLSSNFNFDFITIGVIVIAEIFTLFSTYIGWRALKDNTKNTWIASFAINFVSIGGTSFRGANLNDADFSGAILKCTDFRNAKLKNTNFFQAKMLDLARPGKSYLQNPQVRELLVTRQGQNKNFDHQNLRGANLQGANLVDASFIGADLSEANLQEADLSRAILKQTHLDGTDFTGATLTGAIIGDWGITSHTKFNGVRCEYVYMRLPTKENPDPWRKPDNREEVFADGEFGDFIQPIFDTLDLYHNQGVDPRAIAIAFKELTAKNPEAELEIVAAEKRGRDKFLLRTKTAPAANKSELSAEYFADYNHLKCLSPPEQIKHFFNELKIKDSQINFQQSHILRLENMINTALENPRLPAQIETNKSTVKTILILASNPKKDLPLRLDEEVREIDAGLQRAKKRELFDLKQRWAVRVQDVYQALLDFKPQIVHFSGHGSRDDGLFLEDEVGNLKLVDTEALAKLFELFSTTIECVILNACYSEVQAQAIAKHIPYTIGMNQEIGDKAAVKFATGFYNALGAGESVEFAYQLGCNVIQLDGIPEHLKPVLKRK